MLLLHRCPRGNCIEPLRAICASLVLGCLTPIATVTSAGVATLRGAEEPLLSARLSEAPYPYVVGGVRSWPFLSRALRAGQTVHLAVTGKYGGAHRDLADGLDLDGLTIAVNQRGHLEISDLARSGVHGIDLDITVRNGGQVGERRSIRVIPAVAAKPVTYYADFGDELVVVFGAGTRGPQRGDGRKDERGLARYDKAGLDQYFRRLQCQGVARVILDLSPFSLLDDGSVYAKEDYALYRRQVEALFDDRGLIAAAFDPAKQGRLLRWLWQRDLMSFRLDTAAHAALAQSAREHGITLGAACNPFEHAVRKHYEIPVFDHNGEFLWWFQPMSSPSVIFRSREVGFRHYRALLADAGAAAAAELAEIVIPRAGNVPDFLARFRSHGDNLRIVATQVPPLQTTSLVLVRQVDGSFALAPYGRIQRAVERRAYVAPKPTVRVDEAGNVILGNVRVPAEYENIIVENPSGGHALEFDGRELVKLRSAAGTPLGRSAIYFAEDEDAEAKSGPTPVIDEAMRLPYAERPARAADTRMAGMMPGGGYHPLFFAVEASQKRLRQQGYRAALNHRRLVIHRGELHSREMVDYELPRARSEAVATLKAVLRFPAFQEIYVNTRSHTSLATSLADGADGLQPVVHYLSAGKRYTLMSVDLAYAPASAAGVRRFQQAIAEGKLDAITDFQPGEWAGTCQSEGDGRIWRFARNQGVAHGVRQLLEAIEREFSGIRVRIVLPEPDAVEREVTRLAGTGAVAAYQASRNNYIQNIGEGLTLLRLDGLRVEPVLLGTGPVVDSRILESYLETALADLRDNRGSAYRGPKAIMYEGQSTLKGDSGRLDRERIMAEMLAREEVSEEIVYEAVDWAYHLPWKGFEFLRTR